MNYLYKISFLAKKPISKNDDWMLIKDKHESRWPDYILKLKQCNPNSSAVFNYISRNEANNVYFIQNTTAIPGKGWTFYYNEEHDCLIAIDVSNIKFTKPPHTEEEVTSKLKAYSDECLSTGDFSRKELTDI